jgi:hypothetical protein
MGSDAGAEMLRTTIDSFTVFTARVRDLAVCRSLVPVVFAIFAEVVVG